MTTAGIELVGTKKATAVLETLARRRQKVVLRKAVRASGRPFLEAARNLAPSGNRLLRRSLTLIMRVYRGIVLALIGQQKRKTFNKARIRRLGGLSGQRYAVPIHFVENDVSPHRIPKEGRGDIRFRLPNGQWVRKRVLHHPGSKGKHFLRRAAQSAEQRAVREFEVKLIVELARELDRA